MTSLQWRHPPTRDRFAGLDEVYDQLRRKPRVWAVIDRRPTPNAAYCRAWEIRHRHAPWQVEVMGCREPDGTGLVYARWVGDGCPGQQTLGGAL